MTDPATAMLLDELMPVFDATRIEHRVIDGDVAAVYEVLRHIDFMRILDESRLVRTMIGARTGAERAAALVRRRPPATPETPVLVLDAFPTRGEWVLLGERPPHEVAFGVIGRFWAGETVWETIDAGAFAAFDEPGRGKIGCNFSLRPYGARRTLLSYEARTLATDASARRGFMRYWSVLSPFIGIVMRAQLRLVAGDAARG